MNIEKLKSVLPLDIYNELSIILSHRSISKTQLAQLLANCAHETQGWTKFVESLNYKPERLLSVFPKQIKTLANAKAIVAKGQVAIADAIYGGRMNNVKGTSDGFDFRGSGCLQLTGRYNYTLFDATVPESVVDNPELVRTLYKLTTAFWFFDYNGLWVLANKAEILPLRKRINGGTNGLQEVQKYFNQYIKLIEA